MGYIRHDLACIVVSEEKVPEIESWRECLSADAARFVVGPVVGVNGYVSYAVLPDGSKEGWGTSNDLDGVRDMLLGFAKSGRWSDDGIQVRFGGDDPDAMIMANTRGSR